MNPLIEQMTVEAMTRGVDAIGTPTETWSELCTVRCSVNERPGSRDYDTDTQMNAHSFFTLFYTRYIPELTYNCRIRYLEELYTIRSITPVLRRKGHEILCKRIENDNR